MRSRSSLSRLAVLFAMVFSLTGAPGSALGASTATFAVNDTVDRVDAALGDGECQSAAGTCTLRAAVQESRALAAAGQISGVVINVPPGTYVLSITGSDEALAATGDLDLNIPSTTINGAGIGATIIDGSGSDRVFEVSQTVSISNLTLRNGMHFNGGLVDVLPASTLSLTYMEMLNEQTFFNAGVLRNYGTANLVQVTIRNPSATSASGLAARHADPAGQFRPQVGPQALYGGGIFNVGTMTLTDSVISGQSIPGNGGGIWNEGQMTMTRGAVRANEVSGHETSMFAAVGAGIANKGTLTLIDATVDGNIAGETVGPTPRAEGGGIWNSGTLDLLRSTVSNNVAQVGCTASDRHALGGGIRSTGTFRAINSTISGNVVGEDNTQNCTAPTQASLWGAGLYSAANGTVANVSIANNTAHVKTAPDVQGLALYAEAGATVQIGNTILASATSGKTCNGSLQSSGGNLASDGSCSLSGPGDQANANPGLGLLTNNGGPTQTLALLPGSPAIDKASNATCQGIDQRSEPRPRDGNADGTATCDVGAYEAATSTAPPVNCTPRPPVTVTSKQSGPGALSVTVAATGTDTRLQALEIGNARNALIDVEGRTGLTGNQTVPLASHPRELTFTVRRSQAGAVTVPLVVVDDCGGWQTFVGLGAGAP